MITIECMKNEVGHWQFKIIEPSIIRIDQEEYHELKVYIESGMWNTVFEICKKHSIELRIYLVEILYA